jgi:hypothetical protein
MRRSQRFFCSRWLAIGALAKTDGDPSGRCGSTGRNKVICGRFLLSWGRPDSANLYRYFPALFERLVALATRFFAFLLFFESWQLLLLSPSPYYILLCRLLL